jgi:hypothetical protein
VSLGVLAVLAAAAAVYTTRAVLVRVLIALLAALIGGTVLGLVGALMAIPVAAGLKVLLAEQLHARDAADTDSGASEDGEAVLGPAPADEGTPSPGGVPGGQA